jgi:hypothetical protein
MTYIRIVCDASLGVNLSVEFSLARPHVHTLGNYQMLLKIFIIVFVKASLNQCCAISQNKMHVHLSSQANTTKYYSKNSSVGTLRPARKLAPLDLDNMPRDA